MELYEVGGKIRDELLGLKSNDVDYTVVVENPHNLSAEHCYNVMNGILKDGYGFEIFLKTPECFTTRAKFPENHKYSGVADFVMARKEVGYIEGTRQPIVEAGTLYDDLERRDFTCNAIAKDSNGNLIDPFNGVKAIKERILDTPLDPSITFSDDPLRILRCFRFSITKDFFISTRILSAIGQFNPKLMDKVSTERIYEEIKKISKHDPQNGLFRLHSLISNMYSDPNFYNSIFRKELGFIPTMKQL